MKQKTPKTRNRIAISAWNKSGAGKHKDKNRYDRKRNKKIIEEEK